MDYDSRSEEIAIARTREGDSEAFAYIVRSYKNYVYTIIVRNHLYNEEADEVFQEIFARAFERIGQYKPQYSFKNWLFTVALNYIRNYNRSKRVRGIFREKARQEAIHHIKYPSDETSRDVVAEAALNRELSKLPKKYFQVIMLYYYEDKKYEEIAGIIEKPVGTVKTYLHRARERLKKSLKQFDEISV